MFRPAHCFELRRETYSTSVRGTYADFVGATRSERDGYIPPRLDFLADVAHTMKVGADFKVVPVFMVQNQNVFDIFDHVGDFQLEFVVIGDNFKTVKRTIKFRFEGKSLDLLPLP
jgi:hypothetical protein